MAVQSGRPWVVSVARDILHHVSPQPSVRLGADLGTAARAVKRARYESLPLFVRHLQTWANFHVALGVLSVSELVLSRIHILRFRRYYHVTCRLVLSR